MSFRVQLGVVAAASFIAVFAFAASAGAAGPNLSRFYGQKLTWTACETGDQCTWLTVPRSYTTRSTRGTFRIRVIRQPATGTAAERKGVLVLNPGGPGGSGYSTVAHNTIDNAALHKAYDFVGFDPRGVGKSNPLDCGLTNVQIDTLNFTEDSPRTPFQRASLLRAYGILGMACSLNAPNVFKYMDSASVVRDMDILRGVLRQPKLNWMGFSYGTKLGATYAELFPRRVGRMVLDGVVPTENTYEQEGIAHAKLSGQAIKSYFATCKEREGCPFADPKTGEAQMVKLMESLRRSPRSVTTDRASGIVDDTYLRTVFNEYTDSNGDYRELDNVLDPIVKKNDLGPLFNDVQDAEGRLPDGSYKDNGIGLGRFFAIKCMDSPNRMTVSQLAAAAKRARAFNPLTGEQSVWAAANCLNWPARTTMRPHRFVNRGQPKIMLVGSAFDYTTPLTWAIDMHRQIKRSVLVRTDNMSHTSYAFGNVCVVAAVNAYLLDGKTFGADVRCNAKDKTPVPVGR